MSSRICWGNMAMAGKIRCGPREGADKIAINDCIEEIG